jgi:hypothetical protein
MFAWENRKKDQKEDGSHVQDSELMNLTDRENREFRVSASKAIFIWRKRSLGQYSL